MKTRNTPDVTELRETPNGGSQQRMVRHPRPVKTEYSCAFEEGEDEYDTLTLHQNLEVPAGDNWLIELNLVRWRSKKELAAYLRFAASVVEGMPNDQAQRPPI